LVGVLVSALCFTQPDYLVRMDIRAMDFRLLQRGPIEPLPNIVIVAVDNESLEKVGRWVWPRAVIGDLVRRISAAEPKVIALDIVFSEPSDFQGEAGLTARPEGVSPEEWEVTQATLRAQDRMLAEAIKESGRVVLGYALDLSPEAPKPPGNGLTTYNWWKGKGRLPEYPGAIINLPDIQKAGQASGYFNIIPDKFDGMVRRMPLALNYDDGIRMPLALAALKVVLPNAPLVLNFNKELGDVENVTFGPIRIPVAEDGQLLINYRGRERPSRISAAAILRGAAREVPRQDRRCGRHRYCRIRHTSDAV
jgi:adenylate cyclase